MHSSWSQATFVDCCLAAALDKIMKQILLLISFSKLVLITRGYVYDLDHSEVLSSPSSFPKSFFGYSLDFTRDYNQVPWLMVGAPKDVNTLLNPQNPSGSLNACNVDLSRFGSKSHCSPRPPNLSASGTEIYDDQLLGVVVSTVQTSNSEVRLILFVLSNVQMPFQTRAR
jgi:hypothetical protein